MNNGEEASLVASDMKITLTTVLRWKRDLKESKANGGMNTLVNMDRVVVGEVLDKVVEANPDMVEAAGTLTKGLDYSERLSGELQKTALQIAAQAKSVAMMSDSATDLLVVTDIICQLQVAFFNSNSTQVNVQNNYGYSEFLSDEPAA